MDTELDEASDLEAKAELIVEKLATIFFDRFLAYLKSVNQNDSSFIYQTALIYAANHNKLQFTRTHDKYGVSFSFKAKQPLLDLITKEMHRRIVTDKNKQNRVIQH
jgi:hypothetical protein